MSKKIISIVVALNILMLGIGVYGGMKYAQMGRGGNFSARGGQNFSNLTPEERQARFEQAGAAGALRSGMGNQAGGGFVTGEIISKDEKSITVKLSDGGSKIIFYSETTEVGKFANGTASDLEVGKSVTVMGIPNQDGSVTATAAQIRPEGMSLPRP